MRKILVAFVTVLLIAALGYALRCGGSLAKVGDSGFQLIRKCGEPNQRRDLGYTVTKDGKREYVVEKWIYGPDGGYYYEITLEGDKITVIDMVRE